MGGVRTGDVIVGIGDDDVRWLSHEQVVALVREADDCLPLRLVTPMDGFNVKVSHIWALEHHLQFYMFWSDFLYLLSNEIFVFCCFCSARD